jgi:hypothetical protein
MFTFLLFDMLNVTTEFLSGIYAKGILFGAFRKWHPPGRVPFERSYLPRQIHHFLTTHLELRSVRLALAERTLKVVEAVKGGYLFRIGMSSASECSLGIGGIHDARRPISM